ncbi:MAG TPA: ABC transporter permease, partial [Bacilli bacterium]|nr:ABC transporter permease [Bacilli bacterium]
MISFAKRNLLVFFKDRSSVFFSLLAVFIIIGLYALFLGDAWTNSINVEGGRFLMDSWIGSGLLAVVSVTTTMGAFGIMVEDKTKKIVKDFISSPLKRTNIAGGYILSAYLIGIIMSLITLVLVEIYIIGNGGTLISFSTFIKVLGILILSTFANTSIMLFIVSFFNSNNAFSTASTIIGTIIGFLTGIYLPIGQLPKGMQWVIKLFPPSHSAALFRQVMMEEPMAVSFAGAPEAVVTEFKEAMGVIYKMG